MVRTLSLSLGATALLALAPTTVHADDNASPKPSDVPAGTVIGTRNLMVVTPPEQFNSSPAVEVSNVIWMNRCTDGCMITGGTINDARQHIVAYIAPGQYQIPEFSNNAGEIGTAADAEWNQLVQCVKEMYSPFNITVTDVKPASGNYSEAIVGGVSGDLGMDPNVGGVAAFSCAPRDNAISFTFSDSGFYHYPDLQTRIWELCAVVGQESAHNFSLDHAYEFFDGTSACNDPMTYRTDCGGQRFFRNKQARCGEYEVRDCYLGQAVCGGSGTGQNSHQKLLSIFGAGQSLIPAPTVAVTFPAAGGTLTNGQAIAFQAGSKRGVEKNELYLNGFKWGEVAGAGFGPSGQKNPADYTTTLPNGVPDGVIDIQVKAYDDLGLATMSEPVTVTKGAPCTSADSCLAGQKCDAGKCYWDPPSGQLGDSCDYNQFCESLMCVQTDDGGYCSQECVVGSTDSCPMGMECVAAGTSGACLPADTGGGCCSVGGGGAVWVHGGVSLLVLGMVLRRRRRRADRL